MTNAEMRHLAMKLAHKHGFDIYAPDSAFPSREDMLRSSARIKFEAVVRDAVEHGLMLGAEVCDAEESNDMTCSYIARRCADLIRARNS